MSYLDWHVGMKVALKDGAPVGIHEAIYPKFGIVYTVREIGETRSGGSVIIRLREIHNELDYDGFEPGFGIKHFRPVEAKKTDISIFTSMLTGTKQKVSA